MRVYSKYILSVILAGAALPVSAQVRITEIMYDREGTDSGYEWVEVYNPDANEVDLSSWSLFENGVNHRINSIEGAVLESGSYGIVADNVEKFQEDHPTYTGALFDSAFSLSNQGEALALKDTNGVQVSEVVYDPDWGGGGNGTSLQIQDDSEWIQGLPTPGEENTVIEFIDSDEEDEEEDSNDNSGNIEFSTPESEWPFPTQIYVEAGENRRVFVDEQVEFEAEVRERSGDEVRQADYTWAFGDGRDDDDRRVEHTFSYAGRYSVVLTVEVGPDTYQDRLVVEAIEPEVAIEEVTPEAVTIRNNTDYEMEIGGWGLEARADRDEERLEFSEYTYILPEQSLTLPFAPPPGAEVVLRDASGDDVSTLQSLATDTTGGFVEQQTRIDELFARLQALN